MKLIIFVIVFTLAFVDLSNEQQWETTEITGYHFHTYFFQDNDESKSEALAFRETIQELTETFLAGCRLNNVNYAPRGPHPIGSYETCCNSSSLVRAQSFFMQNRGNLSVLLHPLTRYVVLDHTTRAMWLGKDMPLDISTLSEDVGAGNEELCLPIELNQNGGATFMEPNLCAMFLVFVVYVAVSYKFF